MKNSGLLHGELCREIAMLGHTQTIVISDVGLPIPEGLPVIDLAVTKGLPSLMDVLSAVLEEGVFESAIIASELKTKNPEVYTKLTSALSKIPCQSCSHEDFKDCTETAQCIVRTGEASPYANVILIGGVNF